MKRIKFLPLLVGLSVLTSFVYAADANKDAPPESRKAKCCAKAEKDGGTCSHDCCAEAAKAGKNCEKCGGAGAVEKKK